jgi:protein-tyrosine kinase
MMNEKYTEKQNVADIQTVQKISVDLSKSLGDEDDANKSDDREVKMTIDKQTAAPGYKEFYLNFKKLEALGFITPQNRRSLTGEEMRLIKRRLFQKMAGEDETAASASGAQPVSRRDHVILVTSSRPGEGKSHIALNLALSVIMDEAYNVLLVDADIARPGLSRVLESETHNGLADLLCSNNIQLSSVIKKEKNYPLMTLAAGQGNEERIQFFGGKRMQTVCERVIDTYKDRIIIFDAPPLLAGTESALIARYAGQIIYVVDSSETPCASVEAGLDILDKTDNVSFVLNKTRMSFGTEQFGSYYEEYMKKS